jgi:hypothetical protein
MATLTKRIMDMSNADGYTCKDIDVILRYVKMNKLVNCLFTVIDGDRLEEFLENGTYRKGNTIYAYTYGELNDRDYPVTTILDQYRNPLIVVYDPACFQNTVVFGYRFLDPNNKQAAIMEIIEPKY